MTWKWDILEVDSMVVTWWIVVVLPSGIKYDFFYIVMDVTTKWC